MKPSEYLKSRTSGENYLRIWGIREMIPKEMDKLFIEKANIFGVIDGFDFSKRFSDAGYFGFGKNKLNEFMREELKKQIEGRK